MPDSASCDIAMLPRPTRLPGRDNGGPVFKLLQSPFAFVLLCALGALPLLFTTMPPLTDLGGHLGRYAVQLDGGASAALRQWYSYRWSLIPNLGVDLLMQVLAPKLGLEPALKLVVIAVPVLQIAGWLLLARAVHGHVPPLVLFALPLAYGYPFQYGFLNFTLCAALATCCLALWIALAKRECALLLRWAIFGLLSCVLWIAHLAGWAVFCILAGADEIWWFKVRYLRPVGDRRLGPQLYRAAARSMALLSCLLAPWLVKAFWPGASSRHGETKEFLEIGRKLGNLVMVLRDRWAVWDIAAAAIILAIIGWSWSSRRFDRAGGLVLGTAGLALVYFAMPGQILGSAYADMRLVPTMLAMGVIAACPRPNGSRRFAEAGAIAGLIFCGARLAGNGVSMARFDRQFSADLTALAAVPHNSELVSVVAESCHQAWWPWQRERRTHLGGYAIARYHDFSNDEWIIPGGQLLQIHNPAAGKFSSDPSEFSKNEVCPNEPGPDQVARRIPPAIRYLWILDKGQPRPIAGWHAIRSTPGSVVYQHD